MVNERIKQIREEHGLSQAEFAKRINVSDAAVSKLESGKNNPSKQTIKLICSEFHIQYQWLTEGTGPKETPYTSSIDQLIDEKMAGESELARSIMKSFAKLPDSEWTRLKEIIDSVRKEGHP